MNFGTDDILGASVLIVDDQDANVKLLERLLRECRLHECVFDDGAAGRVVSSPQESPWSDSAGPSDARPERVNDFSPPFVMNLLRKAVMISG